MQLVLTTNENKSIKMIHAVIQLKSHMQMNYKRLL